ncbi:hypothetical protein L1887_14111 [Cichorium endivia]|nr:hypothetical protein L1887_14111 [Cichorium endivia]
MISSPLPPLNQSHPPTPRLSSVSHRRQVYGRDPSPPPSKAVTQIRNRPPALSSPMSFLAILDSGQSGFGATNPSKARDSFEGEVTELIENQLSGHFLPALTKEGDISFNAILNKWLSSNLNRQRVEKSRANDDDLWEENLKGRCRDSDIVFPEGNGFYGPILAGICINSTAIRMIKLAVNLLTESIAPKLENCKFLENICASFQSSFRCHSGIVIPLTSIRDIRSSGEHVHFHHRKEDWK